MKRIEDMADSEFLRWLVKIGQTTRCEETMAKPIVAERLERIAKFMGGANASDFETPSSPPTAFSQYHS